MTRHSFGHILTPVSQFMHYIRRPFVSSFLALMFIRFIGLFGQTCLETIVTPMMKTYFNYGDLANSILYLSGGGVLILVFIVLTFASKKFMDRSLILFGLILNIITYIWFLSTVPYYKTGELFFFETILFFVSQLYYYNMPKGVIKRRVHIGAFYQLFVRLSSATSFEPIFGNFVVPLG